MADQKISDLTDGGDLQAADQIPIDRAGANFRISGTGVTDLMGASFQPLDSDLTAIAALATTSFGRALLTLADAAALRTTGGLVIGTNIEAWDADLDDIAALTPTNDDVVQRKAGHWTNRTMAQLIADLAALGTTFQPLDSDLTAIAALTTTAFGRGLLTAANAAGLGITAADVGALGATAAAGGDLAGTYPNPTLATGKILASVQYAPGSLADKNITGTSLTAIDTTNLTASFTVPNSGKVVVRFSAMMGLSAGSANMGFGLLNHSGGAQLGFTQSNTITATTTARYEVEWLLTGLSAGTLGIDIAAGVVGGITGHVYAKGATGVVTSGDVGPALIVVQAA